MAWHGVVWVYDVVWWGMVRYGVVRRDMVWYGCGLGLVWRGMVVYMCRVFETSFRTASNPQLFRGDGWAGHMGRTGPQRGLLARCAG